jgi:hypothetical protein
VEDVIDQEISETVFRLLLERMTLEDYGNLRKYGDIEARRLRQYVSEIQS